MITTRFYLDCRRLMPGMSATLKLAIYKDNVRALIPLNIRLLPEQWNTRRQRVADREIQSLIDERKAIVDNFLFRLESAGELAGLRSCEIKDIVIARLFDGGREPKGRPATPNNFEARFRRFAESRPAEGTRELYRRTWIMIKKYAAKRGLEVGGLTFEDIDVGWLREFDNFLEETSPSRNARNIHFRNIRAVFNDALDDEVITCYPFRKFKIKGEATRKRALSIEKLRLLFRLELGGSNQRYVDFLKLSFLLCGINVVDLCNATEIVDGRLEYKRAKTHRLYSIKVEPEAAALIEKYRGVKRIVNFSENCKDYRFFYRKLGQAVRDVVSPVLGVKGLSTYWMRHSWATVAAELEIPKETIAAALGHGGNTVTDIYIDFDQRKVDKANRNVLNFVLGK